jgi:hypothetical protein
MKYDIDGHLWWAPTRKLGGGWCAHKDTPSAPTPPDPNVVSKAQTDSNVETARKNAELNRVNQFTPYGNLVYSQSKPGGFDQAGYDKAMADYNAKKSAAPTGGATTDSSGGHFQDNPMGGPAMWVPGPGPAGTPSAGNDPGAAPTRDQFMTPGSDTWNATVSLTPEQQALLDQDNRIKAQLGNTAEQGLSRVDAAMAQPFDTSRMTSYRDIPTGGGNTIEGRAQNASLGGDAKNFVAPDLNYKTELNGKPIQMALPNSDYANQRTSVEDAIYSRVNPQLQRDRQQLDQRLANQGIMPGSEAYTNAIDESTRQANDARMQAVLAGGQEQSRLAGLDLQAGQFANQAQGQDFGQQATNANLNNSVNDTRFNQAVTGQTFNNAAQQQNWGQQLAGTQANNAAQNQNFSQGLASNQQNFAQQAQSSQMADQQRQQQLQEQAYLRSLPLNELNALRTGSQVTNPQFSAQPQTNVAGTNVAGNIQNNFAGQQQNYSNQTATNNSFLNGLFSLGGAALMA